MFTSRIVQIWLIAAIIVVSWLLMMIVHEAGHVIAGIMTGGNVAHVDLHPLRFSSTFIHPNPHPLVVIWSGPLFGCLLPVLADGLAWFAGWRYRFILRFFAGFCLIANGVYIGLGWIDRIADAGDLMRHETPLWQMIAFGLAATVLGFVYWHNLGSAFRARETNTHVHCRAATGLSLALAVVITLELYFS